MGSKTEPCDHRWHRGLATTRRDQGRELLMRTVQKLLWLFFFCCVAGASGDAAPDRDGDRVISGVGVVAPDGSICHGMAVVVNAEGQVSGVIPADQAERWGLVSRVVDPDGLEHWLRGGLLLQDRHSKNRPVSLQLS